MVTYFSQALEVKKSGTLDHTARLLYNEIVFPELI